MRSGSWRAPDVAHERVLASGVDVQLQVLGPGRVERLDDLEPCGGRHVRVARAEDDHHPAGDVGRPGEGAGVGVGPELPVVQAGRVEAHRGRDPLVEGGAERQMAADAEAHAEDLPDVRPPGQVVEHRDAVGVELRGRRRRGPGETGGLARVVELQRHPGQVTRVDLRNAYREAVGGQPPGRAQGRLGELEDVAVEEHGRPHPVAHGADRAGPGSRRPVRGCVTSVSDSFMPQDPSGASAGRARCDRRAARGRCRGGRRAARSPRRGAGRPHAPTRRRSAGRPAARAGASRRG